VYKLKYTFNLLFCCNNRKK